MIYLEDYDNSANSVVLDFVVVDENTLGYLYKNSGFFWVGVYRAKQSGHQGKNGPMPIVPNHNVLRLATKKDFDLYRVDSEGVEFRE